MIQSKKVISLLQCHGTAETYKNIHAFFLCRQQIREERLLRISFIPLFVTRCSLKHSFLTYFAYKRVNRALFEWFFRAFFDKYLILHYFIIVN